MSPEWAQVVDLAVAVAFILSLKGLSSPRTARTGVRIGAAGALAAVVAVFFATSDLRNLPWILGVIAVGSVIGVIAARRVAMTAMPQLVALFNGVGGGAAAIVAAIEFHADAAAGSVLFLIATAFTAAIGSISLTGSIVTFLKLQELMTGRPVVLPGGRYLTIAVAALTLASAVAVVVSPGLPALLALILASLVLGVLFVLPVGGADVPIVISLLNAFTGLAVAAGGYVLGSTLLLVSGTLVGASGALLTRMMAQAMGRPLTSTLFGAFTATAGPASDQPGHQRPVRSGTPDDVAIMLGYASRVIIVPGYGLAVAQAQQALREVADLLTARGVTVSYAIHPVAGRMPGHMNVLLAEADVPYDMHAESEVVNPEFPTTDVALVVGANDVVNPAARTDRSSPIFGMPIVDADRAAQVVFIKRSLRPGFAGVENELLFDPRTTLLFGDAKDALMKVAARLKAL